jgi:hypothetical protein
MGCEQPLVIQYTNLLHQYRDPDAKPIREFLRKHSDPVFRRRAKALNRLFKLKQNLVTNT